MRTRNGLIIDERPVSDHILGPLVTIAIILISFFFVRAALSDPLLPNAAKTPGAHTSATATQLCSKSFHTGSVRNVPVSEKKQVFAEYGIQCAPFVKGAKVKCGSYEVDHLISLEIGGSNDIKNLWPQSYHTARYNAHVKDKLEDRLHAMVCKQQISLSAAQQAIAGNWISEYTKLFGEVSGRKSKPRSKRRRPR